MIGRKLHIPKNRIAQRNLWVVWIVIFLLCLSLIALPQEKSNKISTAPERTGQIKNPVAWFKWGTDIRLRHESITNQYLTDTDPPGFTYSFERMRLRQWNTVSLFNWLDFNLRIIWEGRHYWEPDSKKEWDRSEIVFDNLNCKFKFQEIPLTLTIGRQDIVFGDGWLVSDGTPLDGPRTTYFEAARATVEITPAKSVLDLIYIDQTSNPNDRIPPIFSQDKPVMEQNERGAIINFSNKAIEHTQVDPYFIYKHDEAVLANGDNGDIYAVGCRIDRDFNYNFTFHTEGAYQFGHRKNAVMFPDNDSRLSAFGVNNRLTYNVSDSFKNQFWVGYSVLSGNNAHSTHNHQFDPLWGRWAQYSELFPNELDRPGERSNLHRINVGYQVIPVKLALLQANYHALFAYSNRNSGTTGFSNNGKFKGQLFTLLLKYQFDRYWSALLLGEYFIPGNYYETPSNGGSLYTRNDPATFLRLQVYFTF